MRVIAGLITIAFAATTAAAQTIAATPLPELKPVPARKEWNAVHVTKVCLQALADTNLSTCRGFCDTPLNPAVPLLTAAELDALEAHQCTKPAVPLEGLVKSEATLGSLAWQEEALHAIAAFLVKRAKAEVLASIVFHMKDAICTSGTGRLTMPGTCGLLKNSDPYSDPLGWSAIKAAFEADMRRLPERVVEKYIGGDRAEPILSLVQTIRLLQDGENPFEVLTGLQERYASLGNGQPCADADATCKAQRKKTCLDNPYSCGLYVLGSAAEIFSQSTTQRIAPDGPSQAKLIKISLRLLFEQTKDFGLDPMMLANADRYEREVKQIIARFKDLAERLAQAKEAIEKAANAPTKPALAALATLAYDQYGRSAGAILSLLGSVTFKGLKHGLELKIDLNLLDEVLDHLTLALEAARGENYSAALVELLAVLQLIDVPPPEWLSKYGGFIAAVAGAKDSAEMEKALEAAAAPVGAWRAKRGRDRGALTINGYVGVQGGFEWLGENDPAVSNDRAWHGGLYAPIGLERSWGVGDDSSVGVLLSVIDLGALLDFRESTGDMTDTTQVETSPTVGFQQVFSPGLFATWGLGLGRGGVPLVLGAGMSITPELRSIDVTGGTSTKAHALRAMLTLAIDITIFEL